MPQAGLPSPQPRLRAEFTAPLLKSASAWQPHGQSEKHISGPNGHSELIFNITSACNVEMLAFCYSHLNKTSFTTFTFPLDVLQLATSRGKSLVDRVVKERVCYLSTNEFSEQL